MANTKDPSIFEERSTIGSSDELDEYGVWIKSEPKDIDDMNNKSLPPSSQTSSSQEIDTVEANTEKGHKTHDQSRDILDLEPSIPDIEDLPDLDIEVEESLPDKEELSPSDQPLAVDTNEKEESFGLPDIEEFSIEGEEPSFSESFEEEEKESKTSVSVPEESLTTEEQLEPLPEMDIEELSLEEVSLQEESEAEGPLSPSEQEATDETFTELSMEDFLGEETETVPRTHSTKEEEPLNIDLDFNEEPDAFDSVSVESISSVASSPTSEVENGNIEFEAVSEFDDFLNDLHGEEAEEKAEPSSKAPPSPTPKVSTEELTAVDDVAAFREDLEAPTRESASQEKGSDLSTQLLMKIAEEISSIKNELATLKEELSHLKAPLQPEEKRSEEGAHGGFFEEDEDEKIALTGDELDNILNTAEFTEETGDEITIEEQEGEPSFEEITEQPETIPLEERASGLEQETEQPAGIEPLSEDLIKDNEIQNLMEEGVSPLTPPPEDTSYLEEDLGTGDDLFEEPVEEIDFKDLTLDEPPLEEPSIEAIKLDLEESLPEEQQEDMTFAASEQGEMEDLQEIRLHDEAQGEEPLEFEELGTELPVAEESFAEVLPENFVVSPEKASPEETSTDFLKTEAEELPELEDIGQEEVLLSKGEPPEAAVERGVELEFTSATAAEKTGKQEGTIAAALPKDLTEEIKAVLSYMDQLLESLPEDKIEEFAKSEYFITYKKLFEELGLV